MSFKGGEFSTGTTGNFQSELTLLPTGILDASWILVASTETAGLDPLLSQQPHLDDLRKAHVAKQREHQDWPVHPRKMSEAQRRSQRGIRQPNPKSHDGYRCDRQRQTRSAL